jgi:SAM-dependent methyltransferase
LTFGELQLGCFLRTGSTYAVTVAQLQTLDLRSMAGDLVIGSIAMGLLVAAVGGTLTFLALKGGDDTGGYAEAAAAAADHYIEEGLWTWEFANQKLRRDPIYRYTLTDAKLPSGGTIVDFGCGLGLALVLLKTAASLHRTVAPPHFQRFAGVEPRPAVAAMAARALGEDGAIVTADGRAFTWPACNVVLFLDVLHLIPFDDQAAVLAAARRSLSDAGVVVVREADASMGWAFRLVRAGNHLRALAGGRFRPRFYFRTADQWNALFQQAGFDATRERHGSAFRANVAFKLVPAARFTLEG